MLNCTKVLLELPDERFQFQRNIEVHLAIERI